MTVGVVMNKFHRRIGSGFKLVAVVALSRVVILLVLRHFLQVCRRLLYRGSATLLALIQLRP